MTGACKECPFRADSTMAYDEDALGALRDGYDPSCHLVVGANAIFFAEPPVHRCHGHDLWCEGAAGFREPKAIGVPQ